MAFISVRNACNFFVSSPVRTPFNRSRITGRNEEYPPLNMVKLFNSFLEVRLHSEGEKLSDIRTASPEFAISSPDCITSWGLANKCDTTEVLHRSKKIKQIKNTWGGSWTNRSKINNLYLGKANDTRIPAEWRCYIAGNTEITKWLRIKCFPSPIHHRTKIWVCSSHYKQPCHAVGRAPTDSASWYWLIFVGENLLLVNPKSSYFVVYFLDYKPWIHNRQATRHYQSQETWYGRKWKDFLRGLRR